MMAERVVERIRRGFSGAAAMYDSLSGIHQDVGGRLLEKISVTRPRRILDIGMGTGHLTERIAVRFPSAKVIGVDFAWGMARYAALRRDRIGSVCADAMALPFQPGTMDLVVSNLALQWASRLDQVFAGCADRLTADGQMITTLFGRETFRELFEAIERTSARRVLSLPRLIDAESVRQAARASFGRTAECSREETRVEFATMHELLRWVKGLGANAFGRHVFIGKEHLRRAEAYYKTRFASSQGVFATMEVLWVDARR